MRSSLLSRGLQVYYLIGKHFSIQEMQSSDAKMRREAYN
jgi:hypothetical protein